MHGFLLMLYKLFSEKQSEVHKQPERLTFVAPLIASAIACVDLSVCINKLLASVMEVFSVAGQSSASERKHKRLASSSSNNRLTCIRRDTA